MQVEEGEVVQEVRGGAATLLHLGERMQCSAVQCRIFELQKITIKMSFKKSNSCSAVQCSPLCRNQCAPRGAGGAGVGHLQGAGDERCREQGAGCSRVQGVQVAECRVQGAGCRVQGAGGAGSRV